MSTLYYDVDLKDSETRKTLSNQTIEYSEKRFQSLLIKSSDGDVSVSISDLGTISGLYIKSTGEITATINGQSISIADFVLMSLTALTSLSIACSDTDGFQVDVMIWGL